MRRQRQRRAHQPRDAPRRPAPPPRPLGHVPHAAALRRDRRAAHAAGRLRHATSPTCCAGCAACARTTASSPTFVFSSATIGEPGRLAAELCGLPVAEVTDDGSPRGERLVALLEPRRRSTPTTGAPHVGQPRDRRARWPARRAPATAPSPSAAAARAPRSWPPTCAAPAAPTSADRVRPYRGGYLAAERREIEAELFGGQLRGVVATTALELGIDVGGLDACVLNGFPGTIASMWQQIGARAGARASRRWPCWSPATTSSTSGFMAHPDEVFTRPPEPAVINPANPFVLHPAPRLRRLRAAAHATRDERWWPDHLDDGVRRLVLDDGLRLRPHCRTGAPRRLGRPGLAAPTDRAAQRRRRRSPHRRSPTAPSSAPSTAAGRFELVHPGAVYLHQGRSYRVDDLDLDDRAAIVEPADGDEYTQAAHRHRRSRCSTPTRTAPSAAPGWPSARSRSPARSSATSAASTRTGELLGRQRRSTCRRRRWSPGPSGTSVPAEVLADAGIGAAAAARHAARRRARRHRHPAAVHDLRPLGRRRRVDAVARRHRRCRRSSSTTATRAAPASPSSASTPPTATSRPPST